MSITFQSIQEICQKIGKLTKYQIINLLNDQGLYSNLPSVRDRRLFKTAYRMLKYKNFETNTNETGLKKILHAFTEIRKNIITPDMEYIPEVKPVILNELKETVEEVTWLERIHKFYGYYEVPTHKTKEVKTIFNHEKKQHINSIKAHNGKARSKLSRELSKLESIKWQYDFLEEHNFFPELRALLGTNKFDEHLSLATSRGFAPDFIIERVTPWATKEVGEKLNNMKNMFWEDYWCDFRDMLAARRNYDQQVEFLTKGKFKEPDPKILAEPDTFEEEVEITHYKTVPEYIMKYERHTGVIKELGSVNHLGVKATPEAFEGIAQEIYKISEMPGFGQLKLHWGGVRNRNREFRYALDRSRALISEKINSHPEVKRAHQSRFRMRKKKWLARVARVKKAVKDTAQDEIDQFHEICEEFRILNDESREITKEEQIVQIKRDLLKMSEATEVIGKVAIFTNFGKLVKKTDIPAYALKRYQAILRSICLQENVYTSLKYHFDSRKQYLERRQRSYRNFGDY
jgi:hypothetical protein